MLSLAATWRKCKEFYQCIHINNAQDLYSSTHSVFFRLTALLWGCDTHRTRFLKQQEALLFPVSTSNVPVLHVKQWRLVLVQVLQGVFSASKLLQYWREGMVSILTVQKNTNLKDELLRLLGQGLFRASRCEQQYSIALSIQEARSLARTLWELGQSISTKHLLFSLSQRLRKFF